ncbi:MAG: sulfatase-like hydrolase/transferase, partial [Eubacteriales bacterium]|nr:sulfatase-like hydrolase/transferase [Eubacteriales bacterium]
MKTIVFLMDSLNRRYLHAYGNEWVRTPNMDRLAARSCVFDNHFVGSAPCMPARHDLLTGRLDFLERNWAPVQPFDCTLPAVLRKNGVFSHMVTDHYEYLHVGGENYHA